MVILRKTILKAEVRRLASWATEIAPEQFPAVLRALQEEVYDTLAGLPLDDERSYNALRALSNLGATEWLRHEHGSGRQHAIKVTAPLLAGIVEPCVRWIQESAVLAASGIDEEGKRGLRSDTSKDKMAQTSDLSPKMMNGISACL